MTRPSKLTPERSEKLLALIANGVTIVDACAVARIGYSTYLGWKKRGRADKQSGDDTIYSRFLDDALNAEHEFDTRLQLRIASRVDAMEDKDLLRLQQQRRNGYGAETTLNIRLQQAERHDLTKLSQAELREYQRLALKAGSSDDDGQEAD